jgi:hypothetical protein
MPWGMAVDVAGTMFIGDNQNGHIRRIADDLPLDQLQEKV